MRKIILAAMVMMSAAATAQVKYDISGQWTNGSGKTVFLMYDFAADSVRAMDSVRVGADNTYRLQGTVGHEQRMYVSGGGDKEEVYVDGTPLTVDIETKESARKKGTYFDNFTAKGGRQQAVLAEGKLLSGTMAFFQLGKMLTLSKAVESGDSLEMDSAMFKINVIDSLTTLAVKNYMDTTRNDVATTVFFDRYLLQKLSIDEVKAFYNQLGDNVKQSYPGQQLKKKIEDLDAVNVGGIAPNIELPGPDGKPFSLKSLRGKVVLLDFWASWCGPCLAELPNVKAIYEKYHPKGLEILGVSLDEKQEAWTGMIAKKGMPWHHVSSLKGWKCPVAKRYNVTGIPRMYIIDAEGRIVAQDLRGEALAEKMKEIFGE